MRSGALADHQRLVESRGASVISAVSSSGTVLTHNEVPYPEPLSGPAFDPHHLAVLPPHLTHSASGHTSLLLPPIRPGGQVPVEVGVPAEAPLFGRNHVTLMRYVLFGAFAAALVCAAVIPSREWVRIHFPQGSPPIHIHNGLWKLCATNATCSALGEGMPPCYRDSLLPGYRAVRAFMFIALAANVVTGLLLARWFLYPMWANPRRGIAWQQLRSETEERPPLVLRNVRLKWLLIAATLAALSYAIAFFVFLGINRRSICSGAWCSGGDCVWGPAFWFCLALTVVSMLGAFALFHLLRQAPPVFVAWADVWFPHESECMDTVAALHEEEERDRSRIEEAHRRELRRSYELVNLREQCAALDQQVRLLHETTTATAASVARTAATLSHSQPNSSQHIHQREHPQLLQDATDEINSDGGDTLTPPRLLLPTGEQVGIQQQQQQLRQDAEHAQVKLDMQKQIKALEDKWRQETLLRKKYFNEIQDLKGKIRVFCRVRPFMAALEDGEVELDLMDEYTLVVTKKKKDFLFDRVFSAASTQLEVWEETKDLVQSAIDGFNCCIFAYGQTGSGKTHTMQGGETDELLGITPRTTAELFAVLTSMRTTHDVKVSCYMVELYCDEVVDLLLPSAQKRGDVPKLEIKQDANGIVSIRNVSIFAAQDASDLLRFYRKGCKHRRTRAHAMNDVSSRSHLVFSIMVETTNRISGKVTGGKLSLVDLAGSERLKKTKLDEQGIAEAEAINASLFELGKVIAELSEENKGNFVSKRNSKLTLLMSDSLGGNAKTLMIVCVSPATYNLNETINSLDFAARCKRIQNAAAKNAQTKEVAKMKERYSTLLEQERAEVERLRQQLDQLKHAGGES